MYITLNLKTMSCMYKHRHLPTICKLALLSGYNTPTLQLNFKDYRSYASFKIKQLEQLYTSMTGKKVKFKNKEFLIFSLVNLISQIKESKVDFFKLEYQVSKLKRRDSRFMRYYDGFKNDVVKDIKQLPQLRVKNYVQEKYTKEFLKTEDYLEIKASFQKDEIKKQIEKYKKSRKKPTIKHIIFKVSDIIYLQNGRPKSNNRIEDIKEQIRRALKPLGFKLPTINSVLLDWRESLRG